MIMKPGDCFTIEPPLVQGNKPRGTVWDDGWTVTTDVSCFFLFLQLTTDWGTLGAVRAPDPHHRDWG